MTPKPPSPQGVSDTEAYAASVVQVLRVHFPDLTDPETASIITDLIEHHARYPLAPFEVIVDPITAKWRLKAKPGRDRRRVLLCIHRMRPSEADAELSRTVNDALRALEADR